MNRVRRTCAAAGSDRAMAMDRLRERLEALYRDLNRRRYVHPDPLEFLYKYDDARDREVVALIASSLAYGRVKQILTDVAVVLEILGPRPARRLTELSPRQLRTALRGFKHRFSTGEHVAVMLTGAKRIMEGHGSLEACFAQAADKADPTVIPALTAFVSKLIDAADGECGHLLPDPAKGSACKRLHLMLRWLVRCDKVDPGGWTCIGADKLIVPLDTHMHRIAHALGMTSRKAADGRTAMEVTEAFGRIAPADPVRYDFALTRLGIRDDMQIEGFLQSCSLITGGKICA